MSRFRAQALGVGSLVICAASAGSLLGTGVTALAGGVCPQGVNPYSASTATLNACGISSYARASVVRLPDGGTQVNYATRNVPMSELIPPPGFDAATASSAQLALYGIPPEPAVTSPTARALWLRMVSNVHWMPPPSVLHNIPGETMGQIGTKYNNEWSGYVAS